MTLIAPGVLLQGAAETFEQRVRFDDHQFAFVGSTSATGQIRIRRLDDDRYWTGSVWTSTETWIATTVSSASKSHTYSYTPDSSLLAVVLRFTMRVNADASTEESGEFVVGRREVSVSLS